MFQRQTTLIHHTRSFYSIKCTDEEGKKNMEIYFIMYNQMLLSKNIILRYILKYIKRLQKNKTQFLKKTVKTTAIKPLKNLVLKQ